MLHLLSAGQLTQAIADRIGNDDVLVLHSASIWAAYPGHADNDKLQRLQDRGCRIFAMQNLLAAAGIEPTKLLPGVGVIDYPGLVELSVAHHPSHTWC